MRVDVKVKSPKNEPAKMNVSFEHHDPIFNWRWLNKCKKFIHHGNVFGIYPFCSRLKYLLHFIIVDLNISRQISQMYIYLVLERRMRFHLSCSNFKFCPLIRQLMTVRAPHCISHLAAGATVTWPSSRLRPPEDGSRSPNAGNLPQTSESPNLGCPALGPR